MEENNGRTGMKYIESYKKKLRQRERKQIERNREIDRYSRRIERRERDRNIKNGGRDRQREMDKERDRSSCNKQMGL